jgi:hypothetical protein
MFAEAYGQASKFTFPVAISSCTIAGEVATGLAAFVILNGDGWVLTAAHIFDVWAKGGSDRTSIQARDAQLAAMDADDNLTDSKKKTLMRRHREDPTWIKAFSYWWGADGIQLMDVSTDGYLDLAIGRLEPFVEPPDPVYPTFLAAQDVRPGTSVCRLGFPFHEIAATYDEVSGGFAFPPGTLPIARFPNDGIITRQADGPKSPASNIDQRFFETSTPGLRGQSGGPVFDTRGVVYGIQSRTVHLPLGFSPTVKQLGREVTEHQFLNAGWAVHPTTVAEFLALHKVNVDVALA